MQSYIFILVFFIIGLLISRWCPVTQRQKSIFTDIANRWIITIALPAIIIRHVPVLTFSNDVLIPVAVAWLWLFMSVICVLVIARVLTIRREITAAMLLLVSLGNTSFIGYPMVSAFFSDEVLSYAIFYDQLGSFIALSTFGTVVLAIYSSRREAHHSETSLAKAIVIKIITFPPLIALAVAIFIPAGAILASVEPVLAVIGATLMPLALIVLGLQFQPRLLPEHKKPLLVSVGLKMLVAPLLVWFFIQAVDAPEAVIKASIFESAMPPMMTPGILAIQAGIAPRFCATLLGYSTLLSLFTLPLLASIL